MSFLERLALIGILLVGGAFLEIKMTEAISAEEPAPVTTDKRPRVPASVPGQFVVRLKNPVSGLSDSELRDIEVGMRGQILRRHNDLNFIVVQKPVIQTQSSAAADILTSGYALLVEPNFIYHIDRTPNEPDYVKQWGMHNTGQVTDTNFSGIAGTDIDAERAWDITTGSENGPLIAVIDTGIDYTHPELKDNMWVNTAELNGQAGVDDDANGVVDDIYGANFTDAKQTTGNPMDDNGHGTHCAGVIAARGDNGAGVVGVAWKAKLLASKFLDANGNGTLENAIKAVDYATKMGAKIMSNSWSGGGFSQILQDTVQKTHDAGAVFVVAASNNGESNDVRPAYPASYPIPNIISVAAVDSRGQVPDFSNYGVKTVHVAAPGKDIYSTVKGGAFETLSGTSMATPHVAGVAALLWGQEPQLTNVDIRTRIVAGARPLASLRQKTISGGMLNAYYTLTKQTPPEDPNDPIHWTNMQPLQISTPHPYPGKQDLTYEVSVPGAHQISLFFQKFDIEHFFDTVFLTDRNGQLVGRMNDEFDAVYSPVIQGDYVKIILRSDDSIEKYGFDLTGVAYR